MISRGLTLTLFVLACVPSLLRAQEQSPTSQTPIPQNLFTLHLRNSDAFDQNKMYEDIEVLRRILDRKLQGLYPTHSYTTFGMMGMQGGMGGFGGLQGGIMGMQGGMAGMQGGMGGGLGIAGGMMPVTMPLPSLEGVYLKGQGVVYTATLATLQPPGKTAKAETPKPVSEWESVRRQVRNEKEEIRKPEASKPLTLSDVLLKVLAENGHHFSQLGENESLTMVLTVHEPNPPTPARKSGRAGSATQSSSAPATGEGTDLPDKVRDLVLLGDLHMKQGRYGEAIATYQKAVELKPDSKEAATIYRKLAQCYLNLGEDAKGRALLDQAMSLRKKAEEEKEKPAPSKQAAVSLPVKLIISAPKKLLDEAKEGKLPFEEFRRRASVETVRFDNRR